MDITFSGRARAACRRLGVPEPAACRARERSLSEYPIDRCLVVFGQLEDGRLVRMECSHELPGHVMAVGLAGR